MSRTATANLGLGQFDDNDNPGAGTKDVSVAAGGVGLNANWKTLDNAVGAEHNADGTHKASKIKGSNLIQTGADACVDGSTVEFNSNQIRVKDLGISTAKIAAAAVTTAKIADDNITSALIADNAILTAHIADAQITNAKLASDLGRIRQIYSSQAVAAVTAAAVPTELEWVETSNVLVNKIYAWTPLLSGDSNLYVYMLAKSDSATYQSKVRVDVYDANFGIAGGSLAGQEDVFDNTSYEGYLATIDLTGITLPVGSASLMIVVSLASGKNGTNTGTMKDVSILIGD